MILNVRQAIATGIDRNLHGPNRSKTELGEPATGWLPPGLPGYDPSVGGEYEFDAAKAKNLPAACRLSRR